MRSSFYLRKLFSVFVRELICQFFCQNCCNFLSKLQSYWFDFGYMLSNSSRLFCP